MPKIIFLADDDQVRRQQFRSVLEASGHMVALEAKNYEDAIKQLDDAVKLGVEILVTDCQMPNNEDGSKLAGQLNKLIPTLLVASISTQWIGTWDDPNYDEKHLHATMAAFGVDANGRDKWKDPDVFIEQFGSNEEFSEALNSLHFSIRDERKLALYEGRSHTGSLEKE